jgi:hypothetical protein
VRRAVKIVSFLVICCSVAWADSITIHVPKDHYLGISPPSVSVSAAREKALHDVAAQILRTIGASYSLRFDSRVSGTIEKVNRYIDERFHYSASGFIAEIDNRIVLQTYHRTSSGIVYEMLVHFPRQVVERMRRLSHGAKVIVRRVNEGIYELHEINGVSCVFTEAIIVTCEKNMHAGFLNYYVMKVSNGSNKTFTKKLPEPIILKGKGVKHTKLMMPNKNKPLTDAFLGTRRSVEITLIGTDEIGRPVKVKVLE